MKRVPPAADKAFYVTTPIYYVNDAPHIGHAYTTVMGDIITRWHRQRGEDVWYLTGTDEHGLKVMRKAEENGVTPKEWADRLIETEWMPLLETIDVANDDFIRTTEQRHLDGSRAFWQDLYDRGAVYQGEFSGYYSVGAEEFVGDDDVADGEGEDEGFKVSTLDGSRVEHMTEENYFFKLSEYQQPLLDFYEANPDFIQPASARNEIVSFVSRGLNDLSMSRSTFDWGIQVPWDEKHVMYVWIEALLNYVTAAGYGTDQERSSTHLAGRHPHRRQGHRPLPRGHLAGDADGRWPAGAAPGVRARMAARRRAEDEQEQGQRHPAGRAGRRLRLRRLPLLLRPGADVRQRRLDLLGGHPRPVPRRARQRLRQPRVARGRDDRLVLRRHPAHGRRAHRRREKIVRTVESAVADADAAIDAVAPQDALAAIWRIVEDLNGYLTEQAPWKLAKDEPDAATDGGRLATILVTAAEGLRALAVLLNPVMPKASAALWSSLGAEPTLGSLADQRIADVATWGALPAGSTITKVPSLFPRSRPVTSTQ